MNSAHVSTASNQTHVTPMAVLRECERRFGVSLVMDLACSFENKRCDGAWFTEADDSLSLDWTIALKGIPVLDFDGCAWLNPPFRGMGPWMEKCKKESAKGCKIISLTLSSLGTGWYRDHVEGEALSLILRNRVTFEGQKDPFPKELMISLWGFGMTGLGFWDWKA